MRTSSMRLVSMIVAGALFMQNLDSAIINTSLPQMAASFSVRPVDMSLGITAYILSMAIGLPVSSYLCDRFGARQVFASAIVVFTLASLACASATNLLLFALARIAQGFGASMMGPVGRVLILRQAQKHEILRAMVMITWPALLAPVIAPVIGGLITTYTSWRWNFLLNLPLGLIAVSLAWVLIPKRPPQPPRPFDLKGFALAAVALGCLLYALERLATNPHHWALSLALFSLGALATIAALRHMRRVPHPLLNLAPLAVHTYQISSVGVGLVTRALIASTPFLLPLLFQVGYGISAAASGSLVMVYFMGNVMMKSTTTALLRNFGYRRILTLNGMLAGVAIGLCALFATPSYTVATCAVLLLAGLTRSMQFTCLSSLQFADVTQPQQSAASTLSAILQQTGQAFGVGMSAVLLGVIATLRGGARVDLTDIRITMLVVAVTGVCTALGNLKLAPNAGAAVSGHNDLPAEAD